MLIIRFSSIGDIVLTSPVVRCLKNQLTDISIHYLTKKNYASIVEDNPNIDRVYTITKEIDEVVEALKKEEYDFVIDLHHNLRTWRLKQKLRRPSASFPKLNRQKFMLTRFKIRKMPDVHIVDRYFEAANQLGITNDRKGLDFFISDHDREIIKKRELKEPFIVYAIGAQFATKRMPKEKIVSLITQISDMVILLGGLDDASEGEYIASKCTRAVNLCGKITLNESAAIIEKAQKVITHDTGLMHIAAAFKKPIVSIWGNTVPELGMYPYLPENRDRFSIHEVKLSCRPCSKIGHQKCPKGHFKCMEEQNLTKIVKAVEK